MSIWKGGVPLGRWRWYPETGTYGAPEAYRGDAHTLIFGGTGSGKTVRVIANALLDEPGKQSFIVWDAKGGQVAAITSEYRRKVCGADNVKIINSYGVLVKERPYMKSDKWNPLARLDPAAPNFYDQCAARSDGLIARDSNQSQPHFPDAARALATGGIMAEVIEAKAAIPPRVPSLANVRTELTKDSKGLKATIKRWLALNNYAITSLIQKYQDDTDELANIKSTFETASAWMNSAPLRDDMDTLGGVDFADCAKRPTTIYIVLPIEELENKGVYQRVLLADALRSLYQHGRGVKTTLIIEEAYVIGHMAAIQQALSVARDFGISLTVVFQSLEQIQELYPKTWGLFLSGAVLGFRPYDLTTAKWMSDRSGMKTVPVLSAADPSSPNDFMARPSWQQQQRERIPLGKLFALPQGHALAWLPEDGTGIGETAVPVRCEAYFDIPQLNFRAKPNPYAPKSTPRRARPGRKMTGIAAMIAMAAIAGAWLWVLLPNASSSAVPVHNHKPVVRVDDPPKANRPLHHHVTRR